MKMLLNVYKKGDVYTVNSSFISQNLPINIDTDSTIVEIKNTQVFSIITEALLQNNLVKLPVGLQSYTPGDVMINIVDDLVASKYAGVIKIQNFIASRAGNAYYYDLFEFNLVSNTLYANGIFITNENREEKYIEIIETGKIELIEALETYLNLKDKISAYYSLYAQGQVAIKLVDNANTVANVELYVTNFMASFG